MVLTMPKPKKLTKKEKLEAAKRLIEKKSKMKKGYK